MFLCPTANQKLLDVNRKPKTTSHMVSASLVLRMNLSSGLIWSPDGHWMGEKCMLSSHNVSINRRESNIIREKRSSGRISGRNRCRVRDQSFIRCCQEINNWIRYGALAVVYIIEITSRQDAGRAWHPLGGQHTRLYSDIMERIRILLVSQTPPYTFEIVLSAVFESGQVN